MGYYRDLYDDLKYDMNKLENENSELKKIIKANKNDSLYKKLRSFNSLVSLKSLLEIRKTVKKQIAQDKKKNTKAALKRIANNKEWLLVYDLIINFASYSSEVERINSLVKLHNKRI